MIWNSTKGVILVFVMKEIIFGFGLYNFRRSDKKDESQAFVPKNKKRKQSLWERKKRKWRYCATSIRVADAVFDALCIQMISNSLSSARYWVAPHARNWTRWLFFFRLIPWNKTSTVYSWKSFTRIKFLTVLFFEIWSKTLFSAFCSVQNSQL